MFNINRAVNLVDLRLITTRFVSYNDQAPPPSCLPDVIHVNLSPRPSLSVFAHCKQSKLEVGTAWE